MTSPWRDHPKLQSRFHLQAPDDIQVLVHDGGPRLTDRQPELVWVTVCAQVEENLFKGRVLSEPHQLQSVRQGSEIQFVAPAGEHLLMVGQKYLAERPRWTISPCNQCGLDELFDAPSDLMQAVFPDLPAGTEMPMFTAFCGACGGVQVVQDASMSENDQNAGSNAALQIGHSTEERKSKKWWQFWK